MKTPSIYAGFLALGLVFSGTSSLVHAGEIQFVPEKLNYAYTLVDVCAPKKICAINLTDEAIIDPGFSVVGEQEFTIQTKFQNCPNPLLPGEACIVYVNFCPEFVRDYNATLNFTGTSKLVDLHGEGVSPF